MVCAEEGCFAGESRLEPEDEMAGPSFFLEPN